MKVYSRISFLAFQCFEHTEDVGNFSTLPNVDKIKFCYINLSAIFKGKNMSDFLNMCGVK